MSLAQRFWASVERGADDACWSWTGAHYGNGYASFQADGYHLAHRAAYEICVGPIPAGLTIDHLCRNRGCVNPSHMEPVTRGENLRRGGAVEAAASKRRASNHCRRGHEYTAENTYYPPNRPSRRHCRACQRARSLAWYRARSTK